MTLKRITTEAAKHGIPQHEVHHWWNSLTPTEQKAIGFASGGAISALALAMAGFPNEAILFGEVVGAYSGLKALSSAYKRWDSSRHKKLAKVI